MAGVKITTFLGKAPKISPELLPNTAAQVARNCKLYSGDLIPYPEPVVAANSNRSGVVRTLYALRNPSNSADLKWLAWNTDVDIAVAVSDVQDEQRIYYTGDGVPKVTTYDLAVSGSGPYPAASYNLGLPLPSVAPTTLPLVVLDAIVFSAARDASSVATIVTQGVHSFRTGNVISLTNFTFLTGTYSQTANTVTVSITAHGLLNGAAVTLDFLTGTAIDGTYVITFVDANTFTVASAVSATTSGDVRLDLRSFNAANVEITVVDSITFTYFSPGFQIAATTVFGTGAKASLGGLTQARSYVYTWLTPWDEESIGSPPSANIFIKEGVAVEVGALPTSPPAGSNFVRGINVYRTLSAASGTDYYRTATLWYPNDLKAVSRILNLSRVTLTYPHKLNPGDFFRILNCSFTSFNINNGQVLTVINDYTFIYSQVGANVSFNTVTSGTLYYESYRASGGVVYWGDPTSLFPYGYTDRIDSLGLTDILATDEYDAPPADLQGMTAIKNNILVGFVGNTLYFSEPALQHAWPLAYATPLGEDIVALAAVAGSLLVLTKGYPYIVSVTDPAAGVTIDRIDALYPCLSSRSVVAMGYGIVWATNDGLAVYAPSGGAALVTKVLYNNDTWTTDLDPATIVAGYYGENYLASHSDGGFVFEQDTKVGGFFVDIDTTFDATWFDTQFGKFYYAAGTAGDIYEWDDLTQPAQTMEWKSKVIITKDMINLGAARVIADYAVDSPVWDEFTTNWEAATVNWDIPVNVTFSLWADKDLIFTTQVDSTDVFRLPTGFRTDTYEVGVSSSVRVRAIHLAETSLGLREV
jgi:hypothetical protein